jgi:ribosomal protein S18 acetylase RimI-like enzyme
MMHDTQLQIRPYQAEDEEQVIALWQRCRLVRAGNDPQEEIRRKVAFQPDLFLVGLFDTEVVATAMAGYEGRRGWLNYVAVSPEHERRGVGRAMVENAIALLKAQGCPKVNLQIVATYEAVVGFYQSLGFDVEELISMGKRL